MMFRLNLGRCAYVERTERKIVCIAPRLKKITICQSYYPKEIEGGGYINLPYVGGGGGFFKWKGMGWNCISYKPVTYEKIVEID